MAALQLLLDPEACALDLRDEAWGYYFRHCCRTDVPRAVHLPGGRFTALNLPVVELIRFAYNVQPFQIDGGPGWIRSDRFDVTVGARYISNDRDFD